MHYPDTVYGAMTRPSAGDIAAVKAINGWNNIREAKPHALL
jgi:hypothetical protein